LIGSTKCAFSRLVKTPSRDKKQQPYSLNRSGCNLGYEGASSQIGTPYLSIPSGLHCGRRWTLSSIGLQIPFTETWVDRISQQDFGATFEGLQSEALLSPNIGSLPLNWGILD
jgi:hypothetical protein